MQFLSYSATFFACILCVWPVACMRHQNKPLLVFFFYSSFCLYNVLWLFIFSVTYLSHWFFQVGLPGFDSMPSALNMLSKHERASYCNHYWENQFKKVWIHILFSYDRFFMFVGFESNCLHKNNLIWISMDENSFSCLSTLGEKVSCFCFSGCMFWIFYGSACCYLINW